jgi:predicted nucleic acid-binding protein
MGGRTNRTSIVNGGVLDTNILLRHFLADQPDQSARSSAFLGNIRRGEIEAVLLPSVVLEIVHIFERQESATREEIFAVLSELLQIGGTLTIIDHVQLVDASILYRDRPGISFADAYHCAMARAFHGGVVASFDRKLGNVPGISRLEPT